MRKDADVLAWTEELPDPALVVNGALRVVRASAHAALALGRTEAELHGRALADLVHPDDRASLVVWLDGAPRGRTLDVRFQTQGPAWHPFQLSSSRMAGGELVLVCAAARTDATLSPTSRLAEERYRQIVETTRDGIWTVDADARTTFVNTQLARMLGYEPAELIGRPMYDMLMEEDRADALERFGKRREGVAESFERRFRHKDGSVVHASISSNPIADESGKFIGVTAIVTDLTERRRLTQQLVHAHKMDAVGQLAGGIAHEFNNLLTGIIGAADMLAYRVAGSPEALSELHTVRMAADRAAGLVRRLLTFARRQPSNPRGVDLREILESAHRILSSAVGEDVDLSMELSTEPCGVRVDPVQLEQVLLNLVMNARDAMPQGGRIVVRVERQTLAAVNEVVLTVRDAGHGMSEEVRRRMFEPFFSTKTDGQASGLGLSVVYGIVTGSGGHLDVESAPNQGTTITVHFPYVSEIPSHLEPESDDAPRGTETILVVEDDEMVRGITVRTLKSLGYRIVLAEDGADALAAVAAHKGAMDLVVTDVVMPRMGGPEMAQRLMVMRPDLHFVFVSGYAESPVDEPQLASRSTFVDKPFTAAKLGRAVRGALDRRRVALGQ